MKSRENSPHATCRRLIVSLGALSCALLISSCSESTKEKEYETPQAVCGIKVPADILDPLLPEGEKATERSTTASGVKRCYVSVDDKVVLSASIEWYEADTPVAEIASQTVGADPDDKVSADKRYSYSGKGGAGLIRCEDSSKIDKDVDGDLYSIVQISGDPADASAVLKMVEAYTTAAPAGGGCEIDI
ncbi:hypothetical protein [Streptomyces sp. NPDC050428]|uniref:hypothetical protein n=1 Tax=Streptomyces sp. NPDC050428 TaxID=3155757 RepID=UPI003444C45F